MRLKDMVTGEEYAVKGINAFRRLRSWDMIYTRSLRAGDAWETTGMVRDLAAAPRTR